MLAAIPNSVTEQTSESPVGLAPLVWLTPTDLKTVFIRSSRSIVMPLRI
jgi:hypothetical protein